MIEVIINVMFYIGLLMLFCIICGFLGIILCLRPKNKNKDGIWITKIKKDKRDFIEKGI